MDYFDTATSTYAAPSEQPALTIDTIRAAMHRVEEALAMPASAMRESRSSVPEIEMRLRHSQGFAATQVRYTEWAMMDTPKRLFPASKNRSKRIHKKLVKRFRGEFKRVPCVWQTPLGIIAHPSFKPRFDAAFSPVS